MTKYPLRIALIYLAMASLWILLSDRLVHLFVSPESFTAVQSIKGLVFVVLSAIVLFFLSKYYYNKILRNEREFRKLFKDNPHPMWVYDVETLRFLVVNDAAVEKYKYSSDEFGGMMITAIRPEEDEAAIVNFVPRISDKTFHDSGIWRHKDKNGRCFFVKVSSHSTSFKKRKARVVLAVDVDEQIQNERKIQLSEAKLKGLINNSDDLIWMLDTKGVIVTANEAFRHTFRKLMGFDILISKKFDVGQLPDTGFTRNWNNYFKLAFLGKRMRVEESVTHEGNTEYYEIILNPIHSHNEIVGVGCFARDITQRKESENKIRHHIKKLEEVAWMQSHEVRKPLANILGLLELMKNSTHDPRQLDELIAHMETAGNELDSIVKKIVQTSSSEKPSST